MANFAWFDDDPPQHDPQRAFVQALERLADRWRFDDLYPEHSSSSSWIDGTGIFVELQLPGLTCDRLRLRALYSPVSHREPLLKAEWGDDYLFDGVVTEGLVVNGVDASPEECASWTAAWFERQLRRPIVRREWDRPTSGLARLLPSHTECLAVVEWWFGDTEEHLWSTRGFGWSRLTKTSPSRRIEERPDRR